MRKLSVLPFSPVIQLPLVSVAQLDVRLTGDHEVLGLIPAVWQNYFMEINHEIFSSAIFSLPMIQEVHL